MAGQHHVEQFGDLVAALIERPKLHAAVVGDDFEGWASGRDIPARVSSGELISRRKINATVLIQLAQKVCQSLAETDFRDGACDHNPEIGRASCRERV